MTIMQPRPLKREKHKDKGSQFNFKDLPIEISDQTDHLRQTYVKELSLVTSPESLFEFVKRWRPLFFLHMAKPSFDKRQKDAKMYRLTEKYFRKLRSLEFDPVKVFQCLQALKRQPPGLPDLGCIHFQQNSYSCEAAHLLLPMVLVHADGIAQKFGVSLDLVIIQQNGGMEAFFTWLPLQT